MLKIKFEKAPDVIKMQIMKISPVLPACHSFFLSSFFQRRINRRNPHASQKWGPHDRFAPWPMKGLNDCHSFLGMWGMQQLERHSPSLWNLSTSPNPPFFPLPRLLPLLPYSPGAAGPQAHDQEGTPLHYESPTVETGAHFTFKCLNWLILSDNIFLKAFLPS